MGLHISLPIIMILAGIFVVSGIGILGYNPDIHAQNADNQSVSSSTVCVNDKPCQTMICGQNQPCYISKPANSDTILKSIPQSNAFSFRDFWDDNENNPDEQKATLEEEDSLDEQKATLEGEEDILDG